MNRFRLKDYFTAFARARSGVAAVEFALICPVLIVLYLAGYETTQALSAYRKLTDTTTEIANIISQNAVLSSSQITTVFNATTQIMSPHSAASLTIVLSEVSTDASNNPTVTWSQAYNGASALTKGSPVVMPAGLAMPNTSYVLVQTTYRYTPTIGAALVRPVSMHDSIFMLPRRSLTIAFTG